MAENLLISKGTKEEKYHTIISQISALIDGENNLIANTANISAALKQSFNWFWVGFYFIENDQLILGPFQGDIACTRINYGKGVCGTAWQNKKTLIVDDVVEFPGHISCSPLSKSEIVVPIIINNEVKLILDIDSDQIAGFDEIDQSFLEQIAKIIAEIL